jgi:hypothetical protein
VQTCVFARDGAPPAKAEIDAYLAALDTLSRDGVPLQGVLLYGLARPSLQPGAETLSALPADWVAALAGRIEALGFPVRVNP